MRQNCGCWELIGEKGVIWLWRPDSPFSFGLATRSARRAESKQHWGCPPETTSPSTGPNRAAFARTAGLQTTKANCSMTIWLITYDLRKEPNSDDYEPLWAELKRLNCHRFQESVWLGNLNNTAKEVHDHFRQYLDENDALWVSEVTKKNFYSKAKAGTTNWLENNPPDR
jgi:hypothetical protein